MLLPHHDDVVEALSPERADQPFHPRALPGALSSRQDLLDPHCRNSLTEAVSLELLPISKERARRTTLGEGFDPWLPCPEGGGMFGHLKGHHASSALREPHQREQDPKRGRGYGPEIQRDQLFDRVVEEGSPGLRGRLAALGYQPRDGWLRNVDPQLQSLSVNPWGTPQRMGCCPLEDQCPELGLVAGRPGGSRREIHSQNRRNPRRCQRTPVSSWTIPKACRPFSQTWESPTQNRRSLPRI
jgi:hypothetical protein